MLILAFDISSVALGVVAYDGIRVTHRETVELPAKLAIGGRVYLAGIQYTQLIAKLQPTAVAYEGPNKGGHLNATIQIQRVVGPLLARAYSGEVLIVEIAPASAKKALTGKGNADKTLMIRHAEGMFGGHWTEHEADALGVALQAEADLKGRELRRLAEQAV